ncbi:MAG: hypothetical protein M0Q94_13485, partial [Candidatus Cloacimonetes bacterium]|nr:hypothetical protein [Candidatus Cloacimonadota bacterium]
PMNFDEFSNNQKFEYNNEEFNLYLYNKCDPHYELECKYINSPYYSIRPQNNIYDQNNNFISWPYPNQGLNVYNNYWSAVEVLETFYGCSTDSITLPQGTTDFSFNLSMRNSAGGDQSINYIVSNINSIARNCLCVSNNPPNYSEPEPEEPEPESNSYILYYGSNPNYTLINTKTNLPVVYNVCDEWEEDSEYTLILEETGTETTPAWEDYQIELTSCSGSVNFEKNAIDEEELKYVKFSIYKDEEERIAESENFLQVFYQEVLIVNEWINILEENPLYLNKDIISTTSIKYASFLSEEILTEDTEICIINKDKDSSITHCSDQAEAGISYDEIELDLPNFSTTKIIAIGLINTSNNKILLESPSLMLIVSSQETIGNIITNQFIGTSTSDFLGLNTHNIACSVEDWEDGDKFIRFGCSIKKLGLDVLFFPAVVMEKTINSFSILVKNIFPFNIAFNIKKAWDDSAGKNTPTDLMWLLPLNENGDITLNLPPNWTKGTTTSIVIFGDTIFKNEGTPANQMFKNIRALSTYLLWGGFLWGIYKLAIDFDENEIKNKKE